MLLELKPENDGPNISKLKICAFHSSMLELVCNHHHEHEAILHTRKHEFDCKICFTTFCGATSHILEWFIFFYNFSRRPHILGGACPTSKLEWFSKLSQLMQYFASSKTNKVMWLSCFIEKILSTEMMATITKVYSNKKPFRVIL